MATSALNPGLSGGGFALADPSPGSSLCPEDFSSQHRLIGQTAEEFAENEIVPRSDAIEHQDFEVIRGLLSHAGRLGLTAVDVPEEYGGLGLDVVSSAIVADRTARQGSFSVIFGAHVGLGTLPLVYFGSEEQKSRYLPRLASAEWVGAYALSEASSGSDAMAMRTHAAALPGGAYQLNGEKQWISNAGFADLFTVFARVDDQPTAFLVERTFAGVTTGAEEKKMGIKGSSTRPVLFRDALVPSGNRLGAVGEGQANAFQILNVGRYKLGAACVGGSRECLRIAIAYAKQRRAFGHAIADFGLIRQMIAGMATRLFAGESAVYRTVGMIAGRLESAAADSAARGPAARRALEEFAIECSMVKVAASEMSDRIVDDLVQIHGGYGFVQDYPAERYYRDARVNRIFEGTNEINRLIIAGLLLRRAMKGKLPLLAAIGDLAGDTLDGAASVEPETAVRRATLLAAGVAYRRFGEALKDQQQILAALSDLLIAVYGLQSVALRVPKIGPGLRPLAEMMHQSLADETLDRAERLARQVLAACESGANLHTQTALLRRLLRHDPRDPFQLQREIAGAVLDVGAYPFS